MESIIEFDVEQIQGISNQKEIVTNEAITKREAKKDRKVKRENKNISR